MTSLDCEPLAALLSHPKLNYDTDFFFFFTLARREEIANICNVAPTPPTNGSYEEPDDYLLKQLNFNFRVYCKQSRSFILTDVSIFDKDVIFSLTDEAYCCNYCQCCFVCINTFVHAWNLKETSPPSPPPPPPPPPQEQQQERQAQKLSIELKKRKSRRWNSKTLYKNKHSN
ncbi:hypothetical protein EDC94DRAFT_586876 [Helicostylum pulchrum]|nr:hypothetical protein EDC94DRAFT_586876 [Helicostylum pulchrum]